MTTDDEIKQRNRQLADWTVRIDQANSLIIDGSIMTAYELLTGIRNEMQATALGQVVLANERQAA